MDLSEEVRLLALDTLTGGWFRYGKLSDGVQIRCTWQQEGPVRWLQVENLETGEKNLFTLDVTVRPYTVSPIGPEDDGALRAELSEQRCSICKRLLGQPEDPDSVDCGGDCLACMREEERPEPVVEDHSFRSLNGAPKCAAVIGTLESGEQCGLPTSAHLKEAWGQPVTAADIPAECLNCAPLVAGASLTRVDGTREEDPCEDCRLTYPDTWAEVRTGDQVQGEDGAWYDVVRSDPSTLVYRSIQVVTLLIGDREHTYDMPGMGPVRIRLGEEHRAIRNLKAGFPGAEEIR